MSSAALRRFPHFIPESAPFTPEQRTWLNGFFAGLVSLEGGVITPLSADEVAALMPLGLAPGAPPKKTTARPGTTRRSRFPSA